MRPSLLSGCALAAFAGGFLFTSMPAAAQATPAAPEDDQTEVSNTEDDVAPKDNEDIIVTAQRRAQALSDVPLSMQAYSGEELEEQGIRDLDELITFIPGASEGRGNAAGIKSYQIRGVTSYYGDSTIGYYLDEAAYVIPNRNYAPVARTFDVERVEVLRGPQGTLYGLGSMGGTIRFITAKPDLQDITARGDVGYSWTKGGKANHYVDGAVSVPIVRDKFAIRGTASYERTGGYASSPTNDDVENHVRFQNYRVKALAQPVEPLTIELTYQHNKTDDRLGRNLFFSPLLPIGSDPQYPAVPTDDLESEQIYDLYAGAVGLDLGPVKLESSTGYIDRTDDSFSPIVLGPAAFRLQALAESKTFVQELRAVSQTSGPFEWVVGAIYMDANSVEDIKVIGGPPISAVSEYDSKSWAVYGEASIGLLNDTLRPLVGLRYFRDKRDFRSQNRPPGPVLPPAFETEDTFSSWNPRFNLSYQPHRNSLYYLNIARGFRSGTFNTAAAVAATGGEVDFAVDPDSLWSYEIGTKQTLLNRRLYVELAAYKFDWSDIQLNYTFGPGIQIIRNAGKVDGYGLDYLVSWRPLDGLTLDASGNFNSTKFDEVEDISPAVFPPAIDEGRQLASVPKRTHSFGATYTAPLTAGINLFLNGSYSYLARQGDIGDPLGRRGDSHNLLRARGGLEWERFGLYVFSDNLLNDDDPIIISGSTPPAFGTYSRYAPRTIGIELKFDY